MGEIGIHGTLREGGSIPSRIMYLCLGGWEIARGGGDEDLICGLFLRGELSALHRGVVLGFCRVDEGRESGIW